MSNNQNELNDIMEVLAENAGFLTESDRDIPEDDEAVIRCSAWSHIPVLKTEDENIKFWMQNNQVPVIDYHSKSPEKLLEMRRRSQTASEYQRRSLRTSESVDTQSSDYHYSYGDISLEMGAMSMNQQPLHEDKEDSTRSSSPESNSSSSDWHPGPSSVDTTTNASESPSPFEPETESRRLSKSEKKKMSEEQLEKRRKEANKKNSKNYNKNKKSKEKYLKEEFERKKLEHRQMLERNRANKNMLLECYSFTGTVIRISHEDEFITKDEFEGRLRAIDAETTHRKRQDTNISKLALAYHKRKSTHTEAERNIKLKKENTNTYGSRKSRALHSMIIAELELKLAEMEYEKHRLRTKFDFFNTVRAQMAPIFNYRRAETVEILNLSTERVNKFDELQRILRNENPMTSTYPQH